MKPLNFESPQRKTIRQLTDEEYERLAEAERDYQDMMAEMPPLDDDMEDGND